MGKVYQLFSTLSGDRTLKEFGFILDWLELSETEKTEKYCKYACHELNFFLIHKDRLFFDSVVRPYLVCKKDKTFIDHWLLEDDLAEFEKKWAFQQLNIVEKILLLGRGKNAGPFLNKLFEMLPPDPETYDRLFDIGLKGREFETSQFGEIGGAAMTADELGLDMEMGEAQSAADAQWDAAKKSGTYKASLPAAPPAALRKATKAALMSTDDGDRKINEQMVRLKKATDKRCDIKNFYRKLDKTEEWAENNYYHLPIEQQIADLVHVNAFWNDYAAADPRQPFLSTNFAYATANFSEMMLALAVLDLPFKAGEHVSEVKDLALHLNAESPLVIYHKEIQPTRDADTSVPVVVGQNYFRVDDRFQYKDNEQYDKFVTNEFLYRTAYGCQVVLSNPTSTPRKLTVMLQPPRGAMPLQNGFYSKSIPVRMAPYGSWAHEYFFYFPETRVFGICRPVRHGHRFLFIDD